MTTQTAPDAPSRLATLHPAWGAVLMSISGIALVSLLDPLPQLAVDEWVGLALVALALVTGAALSIAGVARMVAHRDAFLADLAHPGVGAMVAAWPAGLMVLSIAMLQAGAAGLLPATAALITAMAAFVPGVLGTLSAGYAFYTRVIGLAEVPHAAVSGTWFIPVVSLVLTPSILARAVALGLSGDPALWLFLAVIGWGVGFTLFMLLASIVGSRLLVAAPPGPAQAPSWWMWLAPLGAGSLGLLALARMTDVAGIGISIDALAMLSTTVMWGFSVWWLLLAARVIATERRRLRFHLGWWGFGFPSAAFVALTGEIADLWGFGWLEAVVPALWLALIALLVWLAARTVGAVRSGTAFSR